MIIVGDVVRVNGGVSHIQSSSIDSLVAIIRFTAVEDERDGLDAKGTD